VLETDPVRAWATARAHMAIYLGLPNYANNLKRLGFDDADFDDGGSDRIVDAVVAWGSMDDALTRVAAHLDAGADHVCIQVLGEDVAHLPRREWADLADALGLR
jgi:probable F420-dependent oxidoreductase